MAGMYMYYICLGMIDYRFLPFAVLRTAVILCSRFNRVVLLRVSGLEAAYMLLMNIPPQLRTGCIIHYISYWKVPSLFFILNYYLL